MQPDRRLMGAAMRKLLLASSALVFAGSAGAADLRMPVKAAPVVAAVPYTWTGCSVGGHLGAGWNRTGFTDPGNIDPLFAFLGVGPSQTLAPAGSSFGVNGGAGALGGVQAGCDYQFAGNWVIGVGGDIAASDIHGLANDPFFVGKNGAPIPISTRTEAIASLTGRLGYAWDRYLIYGKAGGAWARDHYNIRNISCTALGPCNMNGSTDRAGWTAGVGFEWAFAGNWSALVEYDHYGFGNRSVSFTDPTIPVTSLFNVKQDIDVIKVGINYRFWSAAPVVARY
jgi:outer membrane immunogenic protein